MGLSTLSPQTGFWHNLGMNWDSPLPTKLFMGAAGVVLLAGWVVTHMYRTPKLSAPPEAAAVAPTDGELRDAVASPALPMSAGGWFAIAGAAALSRAAHTPALLSSIKPTLPPRPTTGRTAFSGRRVIVELVKPGVPEPGFSASR